MGLERFPQRSVPEEEPNTIEAFRQDEKGLLERYSPGSKARTFGIAMIALTESACAVHSVGGSVSTIGKPGEPSYSRAYETYQSTPKRNSGKMVYETNEGKMVIEKEDDFMSCTFVTQDGLETTVTCPNYAR